MARTAAIEQLEECGSLDAQVTACKALSCDFRVTALAIWLHMQSTGHLLHRAQGVLISVSPPTAGTRPKRQQFPVQCFNVASLMWIPAHEGCHRAQSHGRRSWEGLPPKAERVGAAYSIIR